MMVSPGSNGISRSSSLKVGIRAPTPDGTKRSPSAVAFATDHVERTETRHDVGHHLAGDHALETASDVVARRANAHAPGRAAAVADQVEAELAVAALGVAVHLAGRQL